MKQPPIAGMGFSIATVCILTWQSVMVMSTRANITSHYFRPIDVTAESWHLARLTSISIDVNALRYSTLPVFTVVEICMIAKLKVDKKYIR